MCAPSLCSTKSFNQSRDLGRVEIAEYVKGPANGLFATYGVNPDDIVLSVHTEDIPLGVDAAISCGLILDFTRSRLGGWPGVGLRADAQRRPTHSARASVRALPPKSEPHRARALELSSLEWVSTSRMNWSSGTEGRLRFDQPQLKARRFESSCRAKRSSTQAIAEWFAWAFSEPQ